MKKLCKYMVGDAGLELATPRSQTVCATNCANLRLNGGYKWS